MRYGCGVWPAIQYFCGDENAWFECVSDMPIDGWSKVDAHKWIGSSTRWQRITMEKSDWLWFYLMWAGFAISLPVIYLHQALKEMIVCRQRERVRFKGVWVKGESPGEDRSNGDVMGSGPSSL